MIVDPTGSPPRENETDPSRIGLHPAVRAWQAWGSTDHLPRGVERVGFNKHKSAVYRLLGCGDGSESIIAKWSKKESFGIERFVYEDVLSLLPVAKPMFHGTWEDADLSGWLFLEDATGTPFDEDSEIHNELVGRWLGDLHTSGALVPAMQVLPDRGPGHSYENLTQAAELIRENIHNPYLTSRHVQTLSAALSHLDSIGSHWSRIELLCDQLPTVFVHGDLTGKNLCFRSNGAGHYVTTLDWEFAGRGVPAVDLAILTMDGSGSSRRAYWTTTRRSWPHLTEEDLDDWVRVGMLFRALAGAYWASTKLRYQWIQRAMIDLEVCERTLGAFASSSWWRV
jgi:hypothetical protein